MRHCIFCGEALDKEQKCPNGHSFKKMCLNCRFLKDLGEDGYICTNEDNMNTTKDKMMEAVNAVSTSYKVDIQLSPLPLKKPQLKCKQWALLDGIETYFE